MDVNLDESWKAMLSEEIRASYFQELLEFVSSERAFGKVFPPEDLVFRALELTHPDAVSVVILGQDPYHDDDQAHGLAFSVPDGIRVPPSLRNIFQELKSDLGVDAPTSGNLESWAKQGVLLLNTVLTVRAHEAHSHRNQGWERFTDAIVARMSARQQPTAFVLWGKPAQKKTVIIDESRHLVICSAHPSPLSARRGFFGSKPFSRINEWRVERGLSPIAW